MRKSTVRRVLVTGATGFIGTHLVNHLVQKGLQVVAVTRDLHHRSRRGLRYIICDLTSRQRSYEVLRSLKDIQVVVHCAAMMPGRSLRNPAHAFRRHNLDVTLNLLMSLPSTVRRFVLVSTVDVYGLPHRGVISESHPLQPHTYYGVYKMASEGVSRVFCASHTVGLTILRVAHVYGEGEPTLKVIPRFIEAALKGGPLVIEGDGKQKRSYIHVQDVVEALSRVLSNNVVGVYNLGGARPISILTLARLIRKLTGTRSEIVFKNVDSMCPSVVIDSRALRRVLHFRPSITIESGLRRQIDWMRTSILP